MRFLRAPRAVVGLLVLLAGPAWAGDAVLVPPTAEDVPEWVTPSRLAGLEARGAAEAPEIRLVDRGAEWEVVVTLQGRVRRATVPAPRTAADREDVAWLAASLLAELEARVKAEEAARAQPAPPAAPPHPAAPRAAAPRATGPAEAAPPAPVEVVEAPAPVGPAEAPPPAPVEAPVVVAETAAEPVIAPPEPRPSRLILSAGLAVAQRSEGGTAGSVEALVMRAGAVHLGGAARLSTPARVESGQDDEDVREQEIAAVIALPVRRSLVEARGALALRSFEGGGERFARVAVPVAGARVLGGVALSESLILRAGPEIRYDVAGVVIREPPWPDRKLPRLTIGLSATLWRERIDRAMEPSGGPTSPSTP